MRRAERGKFVSESAKRRIWIFFQREKEKGCNYSSFVSDTVNGIFYRVGVFSHPAYGCDRDCDCGMSAGMPQCRISDHGPHEEIHGPGAV